MFYKKVNLWKYDLPKGAFGMVRKSRHTPSGDMHKLQKMAEKLNQCQRCQLSQTRQHVVFGAGNEQADLVLVGEAPGAQEDLTGYPFVGRAGKLLEKMLAAIGLKRENVYICNVVKCRPPQNRNPLAEEILACSPFLKKQLHILKPKLILTLGKFAAQTLLQSETTISRLRGHFYTYENTPLLPTFHPSYLLRNPSAKRESWEDLKKAASFLGISIPKRVPSQGVSSRV